MNVSPSIRPVLRGVASLAIAAIVASGCRPATIEKAKGSKYPERFVNSKARGMGGPASPLMRDGR